MRGAFWSAGAGSCSRSPSALLAWAAWWLGEWQFDRLEERKARNAIIERNESAPPTQVPDVMPADGEVAAEDEWRVVTATGEYAVDDTVIVRYRSRDGATGVDVVVPLVLDDGTRRAGGPRLARHRLRHRRGGSTSRRHRRARSR